MSNADKKRAESLANLFAAPAPEVAAVVEEVTEPTAVASAVGVMGKVITLAPMEDVTDAVEAAAPADMAPPALSVVETVVEPTATETRTAEKPVAPVTSVTVTVDEALVPAHVIEQLTTPMRLSGVTRRLNVQVSNEILTLLREVDKRLATSGRPVVSRNALLAMAAELVITNPAKYENQQVGVNAAGAGIQARLAEEQFVGLRAAAYSTDVPLVTTHAMAIAVKELLGAAKKGLRK